MEKVLQELFWVSIHFKRYQNTSGCSTDQQKKFFLHILLNLFDEQNSIGSFVKVFVDLMVSHLVHSCWGPLVGLRTSGGLLT